MYKKRHIEDKLKQISKYFKIVLLLGPRQVGKSTLLSKLYPDLKHITFDPIQDIYGAKQDPDLFLNNFPAPIILDEIQFTTELLPTIKRRVDLTDEKGLYYLTGSQNIYMMKSLSESLAGRVVIMQLGGMTPYELNDVPNNNWVDIYLDSPGDLPNYFKGLIPNTDNLYNILWRGNYPGLIDAPNEIVRQFYFSYIQTYIERDVRILENIQDLSLFDRFLGLAAALTAQEINYSQLGREIGIMHVTANRWLNLLEHSYLWIETQPYSGNTIKRLSKKRKGYIADTGIACYLQQISTPEALARSPLFGSLFETYCVAMIYNICHSLNMTPRFYHWRTNGGAEVDLILEINNTLYPIEIKGKSVVGIKDCSGIKAFKDTYPKSKIAPGLVIYAGTSCHYIDKDIIAMPWNGLFK
ncbi:MAG: ATP-binding protein [Sphingobacteriia bacterium]|nr:ATP-binding protein [Sphingobacteriia bacterium]